MVSVDCTRGRNSLPKMMEESGVQLHLTETVGNLEIEDAPHEVHTMDQWMTAWDDSCMAKIKELKPDIIVADMLSRAGH
jgi:hypothetical protein